MGKIVYFWRIFASLPIFLYQKTLSFDHGPMKILFPIGYCRFHPTCSDYTRQAIMKYGVVYGYFKGLMRILRCHPWSNGGVDYP